MAMGSVANDPVSWLQRLGAMTQSLESVRPLAESVVLGDAVPVQADGGVHVATALLSEVGCVTVGDFRRLMDMAPKETVAATLATAVSSSAGSFEGTSEATMAVDALLDLVQAGESEPRAPRVAGLAAMVRNSKADGGSRSAAPAPWEHTSLTEPKLSEVQGLLQMLGTAASKSEDNEGDAQGHRKKDKVDIRTLIDVAGVGEPSPDAILDDDELKKLAAAAKKGLFGSSIAMPSVDKGTADPKLICKWLMAYVRRAIAELLLWRTTPMGALSELYQIAALGADPAFKGDEGFRLGAHYSTLFREKLFKQSRTQPLSSEPGVFSMELAQPERVWLTRSEEITAAASRAVAVSANPGAAKSNSAAGGREVCCLFHGMGKCQQRNCKRSMECPY